MDQEKVCRDCNSKFIFTEGEQRFFEEKQYTPPNRCKSCRDKRKLEKQGHVGASPSKPILEYVNRPAPMVETQEVAPAPDRTFRNPAKNKYAKHDSRRRKHQQDDGDVDW
jgi:hypothetical protein